MGRRSVRARSRAPSGRVVSASRIFTSGCGGSSPRASTSRTGGPPHAWTFDVGPGWAASWAALRLAEAAGPRVNNTSQSPVAVDLDWWEKPCWASTAYNGAGSKGAIRRSCSLSFNWVTACMIFPKGSRPLRIVSLTSNLTVVLLMGGRWVLSRFEKRQQHRKLLGGLGRVRQVRGHVKEIAGFQVVRFAGQGELALAGQDLN